MEKKLTAMQELLVDIDMISTSKELSNPQFKMVKIAVEKIKEHLIKNDFIGKERKQILRAYKGGYLDCQVGKDPNSRRFFSDKYETSKS